MNPVHQFRLLQTSFAKMTVLLHELLTGKIHDGQLAAELSDEVEALRVDLARVCKEFQHQRDRDEQSVARNKDSLEQANSDLAKCQSQIQYWKSLAQAESRNARSAEEHYKLVDGERRDLEDENASLRLQMQNLMRATNTEERAGQEMRAISDVQVCPVCEGQQLVHEANKTYSCLYCQAFFELDIS